MSKCKMKMLLAKKRYTLNCTPLNNHYEISEMKADYMTP